MSLQPFFGFPPTVNDLFSDFVSYSPRLNNQIPGELSPSIDVHEGKDTVSVDVELPGVKKEDVQVHYDSGKLTISGEVVNERKNESTEGNQRWSERRFGSFSRTITIPAKIDADRIEANFSNGLLTVTLPKVEKSQTKKQIAIK
ncbi:Hsp16-like protein [Schizosaccharomyces pombe]|uniref:Heat shock protein 16 n=1 Tax=Schizosaccharomyces pombe (strain 972 / ATCC 24843) TaxID=284812 RepID=HSP16_SCHPO|nr:heat shock protein Hsp16 [Schizosaccharomyces pombe]O14368.1 RecName: Full=Heat shock protein 16; AltName: Full=16 kDa heat shock protein [Schizosaccharomyces pombe 972h-]3W1Z_A Chain A, Heat shock protein 16 [Schizosaccharomyces pombe 972h-]3W1Z_B Chain B, Heat shock protein 16 [Schizosaccharomyces pombe 972h-]3W1Z_C Chain C, Heat shock protein 16 [Schizosaccharomyces pombe 972h-]3W1Z_D Chain D, Heat shock protein 16 [Schizosaccharomyces pombe 972h-]CAA06031.1 heat shock protein 16 [Schiz|eukprot:NP_596091.1 heat shock protein Hsp16 [Schizosaccharomyces pombe]